MKKVKCNICKKRNAIVAFLNGKQVCNDCFYKNKKTTNKQPITKFWQEFIK